MGRKNRHLLCSAAIAGPECNVPRLTLRRGHNLMAGRARASLSLLAAVLLMAAAPTISLAQITCDSSCDSVSIIRDSGGCVKLRVVNRGLDGSSIFAYRIITSVNSPNYLCNISSGSLNPADPAWMWDHGGVSQTMFENTDSGSSQSRYIWDPTFQPGHIGIASLPICDSGWIELCLCCGVGYLDMPIQIVTYHWNRLTNSIDSCTSAVMYPPWFSDACGGDPTYQCRANCDQLSVSGPSKNKNGIWGICVTITRDREGSETGFTLYWKWPVGCNKDSMLIANLPPGWRETSSNEDSATFKCNDPSDLIENCDSKTFCFTFGGCEALCDHFTVGLHSEDDEPYFCKPIVDVYGIPAEISTCCLIKPPGYQFSWSPNPPAQDPTTGAFSFCVDLQATGTTTLNNICINTNCATPPLGRCLEPTSIPWGWHQTSHTGSTYCYARDSAAATGCRDFEWCFQTCGCTGINISYNNQICVTGDAAGTFIEVFPPDNGTCCNGVWHNKDYVSVTGFSPTCIIVTFHNTHYPCCADRANFSFTLPPGCTVASIRTPSTWCSDTVGPIIHFFGCPDQTPTVACCLTETDTICTTDCLLGFSSWTTTWTSEDNCGVYDTGTVTYNGGAPKASMPQDQGIMGEPQSNSSPNYPNPFGSETNFTTTIPFSTTATGTATIRIVDEKGNVVMKEDQEVSYIGKHFFYFTGKDLSSGTYYYQIEFPKGVVIVNRSMLLVK